jgi:hypothetical protein
LRSEIDWFRKSSEDAWPDDDLGGDLAVYALENRAMDRLRELEEEAK